MTSLLNEPLPDMWLDPKEEMQPKECGHHDDVAGDADEVAYFVSREKEFVDQPKNRKFNEDHSTLNT